MAGLAMDCSTTSNNDSAHVIGKIQAICDYVYQDVISLYWGVTLLILS